MRGARALGNTALLTRGAHFTGRLWTGITLDYCWHTQEGKGVAKTIKSLNMFCNLNSVEESCLEIVRTVNLAHCRLI